MSSESCDYVENKQSDFKANFVKIGFLVIALLSFLFSIGSYFFLRHYNLHSTTEINSQRFFDNVSPTLSSNSLQKVDDEMTELAKAIKLNANAKGLVIVNLKGKRVWSSGNKDAVYLGEIKPSFLSFFPLRFFQNETIKVVDQSAFSGSYWLSIFTNDYPLLTQHIDLLNSKKQTVGYVRLASDMQASLVNALVVTIVILLIVLLTGLLFLYFLYKKFTRIMGVLEEKERKLNESVRNLSNSLKVNQKMQLDIRTASAHAVELNEQFLRRVGADLHDGPAQMIGYANLRLSQVAKSDVAKEFGHEFQSIRQALEDSLDDIRGISSGLVLPELESMSLEECMRKVASIHCMKSDVQIKQDYIDIPDEVPLPIKICAYRFAQEGLNNAEQHGKAEKCRLNARFKSNTLQVSLKDNGCGFRKSLLSSDQVHLGLIGLKDRIESIGGTFNINSELGVGTALRFSVSLEHYQV